MEARLRAMKFKLRITFAGWLASVLLFGLAGIGAGAQSYQPNIQSTVRVRSLEVTDPSGRTRIVLDAAGEAAKITLLDSAGRRRLGIRVTNDGVPGIVGYDPAGKEYPLVSGPAQTNPNNVPGGMPGKR